MVAVTTIDSIGSGQILPGRGFVNYPIKYKAIVFRPIKGEVLEAIVTQVNKVIFEYFLIRLAILIHLIGSLNCVITPSGAILKQVTTEVVTDRGAM